MRTYLIGALAIGLAAPATAAVTLTNGSGDGQVSVVVGARGDFFDALYNPVGAQTTADTVASSFLRVRSGTTGGRVQVTGDGAFASSSATSATSSFSLGDYSVALQQTLSSLTGSDGTQTGSLLRQQYSFTNTTAAALVLDVARYIDGDLIFGTNNFNDDGGGILSMGGNRVLFETNTATGANDQASFIGIYNENGGADAYDIDNYLTLDGRLSSGSALRNAVTGDANNDGFIDAGPGYDVGLALGRTVSIGAGGTAIFTTFTIFGTGTPAAVAGVPEPATWGMMILGFGMVGAAARRRKAAVAIA